MENTPDTPTQPKKDNSVLLYILGGVIVTAIVVAGFLLFPKNQTGTETAGAPGEENVMGEQATAPTATPMPSRPIGTLGCSQQYYNTVNGVTETYFLSTEGETPATSGVTCTVTASINNQVVASEIVTPTLMGVPERGGSTFRCVTKGLKLKANVPVKVTSDLKDGNGNEVSCSRMFLLP